MLPTLLGPGEHGGQGGGGGDVDPAGAVVGVQGARPLLLRHEPLAIIIIRYTYVHFSINSSSSCHLAGRVTVGSLPPEHLAEVPPGPGLGQEGGEVGRQLRDVDISRYS